MASNKVYIVTAGSYSDYRILACFSSRYRAKQYLENYRKMGACASDGIEIETHNLNVPNEWGYVTSVNMCKDGSLYKVRWHPDPVRTNWVYAPRSGHKFYQGKNPNPALAECTYLSSTVVTDDHERAIKVTNELRTQLIASGEWE